MVRICVIYGALILGLFAQAKLCIIQHPANFVVLRPAATSAGLGTSRLNGKYHVEEAIPLARPIMINTGHRYPGLI
jgi:hypothetical protein